MDQRRSFFFGMIYTPRTASSNSDVAVYSNKTLALTKPSEEASDDIDWTKEEADGAKDVPDPILECKSEIKNRRF